MSRGENGSNVAAGEVARTATFRGITVDSPNASFLDDALWVEPARDGWIVRVAFPRLTDAIEADSHEDLDARKAGFTRYGPKPTAMLLEDVSRLASLDPGSPKDAFVATIPVSSDFRAGAPRFGRATFRSHGRLDAYAATMAMRDPGRPFHEVLRSARIVAKGLNARRREAGALDGLETSPGFVTDINGRAVAVDCHTDPAARTVAEIMILANASLAKACRDAGVRLLYRNDDGDHADLSTTCRGHVPLGVPAYAWFTSPIRRYSDMVNQRLVEDLTLGRPPSHDLATLDATARTLNEAYRDRAQETRSSRTKGEAVRGVRFAPSVADAALDAFHDKIHSRKLTPSLLDEALTRLASNELRPATTLMLLRSGPEVARSVVDAMAREPQLVDAVAKYARRQLDWRFDFVSYVPRHFSNPNLGVAVSLTADGRTFHSDVSWDRDYMTNKRTAYLMAFSKLAGVPSPKSRGGYLIMSHRQYVPVVDLTPNLKSICAKLNWPEPEVSVEWDGHLYKAVAYVAFADANLVRSPLARAPTRERAVTVATYDLMMKLTGSYRPRPPEASPPGPKSRHVAARVDTVATAPDPDPMGTLEALRVRHGASAPVVATRGRIMPGRPTTYAASVALDHLGTRISQSGHGPTPEEALNRAAILARDALADAVADPGIERDADAEEERCHSM